MSRLLEPSAAVLAARDRWRYRGESRPAFAEPVAAGEESVWDFPRPPRIEAVAERLQVRMDNVVLAETVRGLRVLETAGAPTYYLPPDDVRVELLEPGAGRSLCEWKGLAESYQCLGRVIAWSYAEVFPEFTEIAGWFAFYPAQVDCYVDGERVQPQPGGYYGGWVTGRLKGPIKGAPGSEHW